MLLSRTSDKIIGISSIENAWDMDRFAFIYGWPVFGLLLQRFLSEGNFTLFY